MSVVYSHGQIISECCSQEYRRSASVVVKSRQLLSVVVKRG